MMITEETPIADAALPVEAFKAHLRLGTGFADDAVQEPVLTGFLRAAIGAIEARTGKVLISRAFTLSFRRWRDAAGEPLVLAPVTSVDAVTLLPDGAAPQVVAPESYRLEADTDRPVLRPAGGALPAVPEDGTAEILLTAGMAAEWGGLPADLGQAVLLLAAHYYEYRHETGLSQGCMPFGVTALIARYRPVRLGMGAGGVA